MAHLREFLRRGRADTARAALFIGERGKARLDLLVAASQLVVLRVGNRRAVLPMIAPIMLGDLSIERRMLGTSVAFRKLADGFRAQARGARGFRHGRAQPARAEAALALRRR